MGIFDSYAASNSNDRFLKAWETLANGVKTAADAYARKNSEPNITINVNYDPSVNNIDDISRAVKRAAQRGVQDR